jgi:predicted porin
MVKQNSAFRFAAAAALVSSHAPCMAQNSVTLYGIVDNGFSYASSQTSLGSTSGGRSAIKMASGIWNGSRFGLKGTEDLGGGFQTVFQIENGFSSTNGALATNGLIFNRQAFVGVNSKSLGSLTMGRQYPSYYQLFQPFGPTFWSTGSIAAHPGDIDGLDSVYRANNTLLYVSPSFAGFKYSGSYSLGGVPESTNRGSTWSLAAQYLQGPVGFGVAFSRINNSTLGGGAFGADSTTSNAGAQAGVSALTNGYQTAQSQQRFGLGASYVFSDAFDIRATYTNVEYIPGDRSSFHDLAIFNTGGIEFHYKPSVALDLVAAYSYTAATKANGITSSAKYSQFALSQYYALSKRTGLYAAEGYQRASGQTLGTSGAGNMIGATATIGDGYNAAPSSSRSMVAVTLGVVHRF